MPTASAGDMAAARRLLNRHPSLPLPGDPEGMMEQEKMSRAQARAEADTEWDRPPAKDGTQNPPADWWIMVPSDSSGKSYRVESRPDTVYGGTYMFCECAAWPFQRGKGKDCKHVLRARSAYHRARAAEGLAAIETMGMR